MRSTDRKFSGTRVLVGKVEARNYSLHVQDHPQPDSLGCTTRVLDAYMSELRYMKYPVPGEPPLTRLGNSDS